MAEAVTQGNVGAGTGATVGKMAGPFFAMKGGLGSASTQLADGIFVGALVVVNASGDVIDPQTLRVIAGTRNPTGTGFLSDPFGNTTIAVVATNASLDKVVINKVAQMADDGIAQVIRPAHTMFDSETIFALAIGSSSQVIPDAATSARYVSMIGLAATTTSARAIVKAIRNATDLHGVPAASL